MGALAYSDAFAPTQRSELSWDGDKFADSLAEAAHYLREGDDFWAGASYCEALRAMTRLKGGEKAAAIVLREAFQRARREAKP